MNNLTHHERTVLRYMRAARVVPASYLDGYGDVVQSLIAQGYIERKSGNRYGITRAGDYGKRPIVPPITPPPTLAARIRWHRRRKNLTQFDVARRMGLTSRSAISDWERGRNKPRVRTLRRLAHAIGVSVRDLTTQTPQRGVQ